MTTTVALTGTLPIILILAAICALLISIFLLRLYLHAVLRSMRKSHSQQATNPKAPSISHQSIQTSLDLTILNRRSTIRVAPRIANVLQAPWHTAAIYGFAGLCFAFTLATSKLLAGKQEILPFRLLLLFLNYAWPVVLTTNLVAASTQRMRTAIVAIYFLSLVFCGAIGIARSPAVDWSQVVSLWLIINLPTTVLLLVFLNRRIRAIGPLVLIVMILAITGLIVTSSLVVYNEWLFGLIWSLGLHNDFGILFVFFGIGFTVFGLVGWLMLVWIKDNYERKKIGDQSITIDAIWLLYGLVYSIDLVFENPVLILLGPIAFLFFKVIVQIGFGLMPSKTRNLKLLLLRVFSLGRRSEQLFDALSMHWRYAGSIQMIAGPDLATTTIEPHEFLDFLGGQLDRRFIDSRQGLDLRISEMDVKPDRDGRFRVNDFFCYDDTWKMTLSRLVSESNAVLMDLRSFSQQNAGCIFEINEVIEVMPLERLLFLIDDTTDELFLRQTVQQSWHRISPTSPNRLSPSGQLRLFRFTGSRIDELQQLLRALYVATETVSLNG
jgi:hypothetical protein